MTLNTDLGYATKPELVQILRLCIGKHCNECPIADFGKDACYRILMVRVIDEFKNDAKDVEKSLAYLRAIRSNIDKIQETIEWLHEVGE